MKIALIAEYYYPLLGGITEHIHHFALEAKRLGHEPVIITGYAGSDPLMDTNDIEVIKIGRSVPIYSNQSIARITVGLHIGKRLREIFKSEKFDIIHVHPPFVPTLPMLAQRYSNSTTFGTLHSQFNSNIFLKVFWRHAQRGIENLHGRIAVSKLCIDSIHKYLDGDFRIIPNGIDIVKFNDRCKKIPEFDDGKLNIFFLSRLEPRNGLEYLIRAFSIIREKRNDCRLIIGGDGPMKTYYKSLVPKACKSDIHFLGRINGVRPNYYATADIFCFPTTRASFGITILEAMASSKPVVAFSLPAYENILKNNEEGILCGSPDPQNLADAILKLLDNSDLRRHIGMNARVRAEDYSWSKVTKQVIDYYEEVKKVS